MAGYLDWFDQLEQSCDGLTEMLMLVRLRQFAKPQRAIGM